jgi:hypothetical protein
MTPGRRSPWSAWLALALAVTSVAEMVPHRHAISETDVQSHDVAKVAATADCGTALHFDRAETDRHTACAACLVTSAPGERALGRIACVRGPARLAAAETADVALLHGVAAGSIRGRAPPVSLLPIA